MGTHGQGQQRHMHEAVYTWELTSELHGALQRSVQLNQRFIAWAWFTGEAKQNLDFKNRFKGTCK